MAPSTGGDHSDSSRRFPIAADERPSETVVRAVSTVTGQSELDLEPLFGRIDPDALDALFRSAEEEVSVTFLFAECEVVVRPDHVVVRNEDERAG